MIKTQNLVPEIYYNRSRDFQLIGRLYDIILNHLKNNSEIIKGIPNEYSTENKNLDLLCTTLGFEAVHEYNNEQLAKLCSIYISSIRNKGSKKSIQLILDLLTSIYGAKESAEIVQDDDGLLYFYIPAEVTDLTLFKDVLTYLIPSGLSYKIISTALASASVETEVVYLEENDSVTKHLVSNAINTSEILKVMENGTKLYDKDHSTGMAALNTVQIPSNDKTWKQMDAATKTGTPQAGYVPGTTDNIVIPRLKNDSEEE